MNLTYIQACLGLTSCVLSADALVHVELKSADEKDAYGDPGPGPDFRDCVGALFGGLPKTIMISARKKDAYDLRIFGAS